MPNNVVDKRTDQLMPGDRVRLPGGLVRTVKYVGTSNFVAARNQPILYVIYREGRTPEWSAGNSSIRFNTWEVES